MKFTPTQDLALLKVDKWFREESHNQQVYRLFGYAGSGKTTLAKHFAEGIMGTVLFSAFTGKAAHVMAQKGCVGARTIHSLIYTPKANSKGRLNNLMMELDHLKAQPEPDYVVIHNVEEEIKKEKENAGRMSFSLNLGSDLKQAKLLIIDEVSMVDYNMGKDLESFGVPILVLGDPEQLPPVYGTGYFTEQQPDTMLEEIHRQALDNPIISMSKMVREGKNLELGNYGESKVVTSKLTSQEILNHDIILTGLRRTKKACDDKYRQVLERSDKPLPVAGDRLMCVKNNHQLGLLNGQIWRVVSDSIPLGDGTVSLHLADPESEIEVAVSASEKLLRGMPLDRWEHDESIEEFEYAYAITVHKSQGSQWDSVLLFDQKDRFPNWSAQNRRRWLYTGITRAAERITVMRL